jgi:hypothetical protein
MHGKHVTSFGICYEKMMIWAVLATVLTGCLQSQPEQAPAPEPAAKPKKVVLQKLMDQFDISGAFDWLNSHRSANKNKEVGE